jgi:hypothetical protein
MCVSDFNYLESMTDEDRRSILKRRPLCPSRMSSPSMRSYIGSEMNMIVRSRWAEERVSKGFETCWKKSSLFLVQESGNVTGG